MSIECKDVTDAGAETIARTIRVMEVPIIISLDFNRSCAISNDALKMISIALQTPYVIGLQIFKLKIEWSDYITTKGIEKIMPAFKYMKSLTEFYLHLGGHQFGDGTFDKIATILRSDEMRALTKLTLSFERFESLESDSIKLLMTSLQYLSLLGNLCLTLNQCTSITSDSIESIGKVIPTLSNLDSLNLNFAYCNEVDDQSIIENFIKAIQTLSGLRNLVIDFSGCPIVANENVCKTFLVFANLDSFIGSF